MAFAIADAVGLQFYSGSTSQQQLLDYFNDKMLLLILDNFEHLMDYTELLSEILQAAHEVRILVTSRDYFYRAMLIVTDMHWAQLMLTILTGVSDFLRKTDEAERATVYLALVAQHPASEPPTRRRAELRLTELQVQLAPLVFAAAVQRGRTSDLESTVKELIAAFNQSVETSEKHPAVQPLTDSFTERELDILRYIAEGYSNREIAERLVLALGTVKWYISEIYSKLDVESRTQAIARARTLNLLS